MQEGQELTQEIPQEEHKKCPTAIGQARQVHPELCSTSLRATNGLAPEGTAVDESSSLVLICHFFLVSLSFLIFNVTLIKCSAPIDTPVAFHGRGDQSTGLGV